MNKPNSYVYKTLTDSEVIAYKEKILDLLAIYYENPEEVFEMINSERIAFAAFNGNDLAGLYTVKHKSLNEKILLAYLGLLLLHPDHGKALMNLVSAHKAILNKQVSKTIYFYSLTSNPVVHKIASKFYANVYPRTLDSDEMTIPKYYDEIISHTGYNICSSNAYKVINSPSVARYNMKYRQQLVSTYRNSRNSISRLYDLDQERGDRILIVGSYNN
ncbi:hypothetical protein [Christiangramia echinicola]|uniref:hypothetical protein n=1 Tax=Christiangramia echinicola TaxID=279359 RepID=UPI00041B81D0|nr:hypothetical protein [Christiangramia echinicola]